MRGMIVAVIDMYQAALRPFLGANCRFHPSCSEYAREAFSRLTLGRALALAAHRLLRCQPLSVGGPDPVPD